MNPTTQKATMCHGNQQKVYMGCSRFLCCIMGTKQFMEPDLYTHISGNKRRKSGLRRAAGVMLKAGDGKWITTQAQSSVIW